jgi:hypothetical protein
MRISIEGGYEVKRLRFAVAVLAMGTSVLIASPTNATNYERWTPEWFQNHRHPRGTYWDKVAWCETHRNWKDGGNWSGGLGIMRAVWDAFGGRQFAVHAGEATRAEQITVANRIAVNGHIRKDGSFRYPVGYKGWGCIKNNPHLKPHKHNLWYEWKEEP